MFATSGFSLVTFGALLAGIAMHVAKQFRAAKKNGASITAVSYFTENAPETITAACGSLVLWAGLPEIADLMPQLAETLGFGGSVGIVSSCACGIVGNSMADWLGDRARVIGGG